MYERVFMSCVTYLLEERKYERLLYIVNKSELDESMRVKLKSRLDMSLIELVNMREVLKLKQ
ncbi:hypothetical protein AC626_03925 [Pseudoalteromonas rubra]|uniref:Uncharacterized protein n=2 Tax=Pseudoalteromonas TaxID=53246 RepID=A0A0L0EVY1_9GAMM|nr:hypothetical protein AC626_03925 [Pseudoalteromonas rubra]